MKSIRGALMIRGILLSFNIISRFSIFLSLASYVYFGNVFTARQVFIVTAYFNFLYDSMLHFWPIALTSVAESYVSIKRIEEFLLLPEGKSSRNYKKGSSQFDMNISNEQFNKAFVPENIIKITNEKVINKSTLRTNTNGIEKGITMKNVTAKWSKELEGLKSGIENMDLKIGSHQLCAIIGMVGSGKSTILQTILGELEIDGGELTVNGNVSFAAQEPWLFEDTVKQNILFTEDYDEKR